MDRSYLITPTEASRPPKSLPTGAGGLCEWKGLQLGVKYQKQSSAQRRATGACAPGSGVGLEAGMKHLEIAGLQAEAGGTEEIRRDRRLREDKGTGTRTIFWYRER